MRLTLHCLKTFSVLGITLIILSGCAGLNSSFTCPKQPGVMCNSLDQVNTMIDQGKLGSPTFSYANNKTQKNNGVNFSNSDMSYPLASSDPLRYPEAVTRIWVAPFEDDNGNYHQDSLMYAVIKPGQWIGEPVKAVSE
jgi:conjugal transfer pilus assembly protein TraV